MARKNLEPIVNMIFTGLQCYPTEVWDRSMTDIDQLGENKWDSIKDLRKVWQRFPHWNPSSTIVFDDSPSKLKFQPHNVRKIEKFEYLPQEYHKFFTGSTKKNIQFSPL